MSRVLFIIFVLTFFLPDLFFRKKSKMTRTSGRLKVATLEMRGNIQSDFFHYKSIRLHDLTNDSLRQIVLKNASALFIYPAQFSKVTQKEYRESIQKIAREIPIVVIGAKIINSDHFCEEILQGSELQETIQAFFYFPNGDDCFFRTDQSTYQDQKELYQAILLMHKTACYADWEKKFYEY